MCAINFGSVATPETRGIVERFFGTLEENGYHRVPSTTGSNIRDVRRENAEKDAINYNVTFARLFNKLYEHIITKFRANIELSFNYYSQPVDFNVPEFEID